MNTSDNVVRSASITSGSPLSRRSVIRSIAGLGVAAVVAGPALGLVSPAAARSTDTLIVNASGARLRAGAGTSYAILATLGKGAEVRYLADGGNANGYRWAKVKVLATGKEGFMAASLLSAPDGTTAPVIIGTTRTVANVNLRSGPSTANTVLRVVPSGASVQISSTVQGGFRYVIHNGLAGWIHDSYLAQRDAPSETFTTTARLNLRAEPTTSAKVLLVMPTNAVVTALAGTANGWRQVSYQGTVGWAATPYLN